MSSVDSQQRNRFFDVGMIVFAIIVYFTILTLLVNNSLVDVYGLEVGMDPISGLGTINQFVPIIVALALFLVVPSITSTLKSIQKRLHAGNLSTIFIIVPFFCLIIGLLFSAASWIALKLTLSHSINLGHPATFQILLALIFDLSIICVLAIFIHSICKKWILTVSVFIGYIGLVILLAQNHSDISFAGFGTSPQLEVTQVSADILNLQAGWLLRCYWGLIAAAMIVALYLMRCLTDQAEPAAEQRRRSPNRTKPIPIGTVIPGSLIMGLLVCAAILAIQIGDMQDRNAARYAQNDDRIQALAIEIESQPFLRRALLDVTLSGHDRVIAIKGRLSLENRGQQPIKTLFLSNAPTLLIQQAAIGGEPLEQRAKGSTVSAWELPQHLAVGDTTLIDYTAVIDARNPFDIHSQRIVMSDAVFLTTDNLIPLPTNSACLRNTDGSTCAVGKPYTGIDAFSGEITVTAPSDIMVATAELVNKNSQNASWKLTFFEEALGNLLLAAANFRVTQCQVDCGRWDVTSYLAPYSQSTAEPINRYIAQELSAYTRVWGNPPSQSIWFVETPSRWEEAIAFNGGIAMGEHLIARQGASTALAHWSKMVLSHELAHLWWGYQVVPEKAAGSALVVEGFAQFAALARMRAQDILDYDQILDIADGFTAQGRALEKLSPKRLGSISEHNWRAYYEAPMMLTFVDRAMDGELLDKQNTLVSQFSYNKNGIVNPQDVIRSLGETISAPELACTFEKAIDASNLSKKKLQRIAQQCQIAIRSTAQ
ncbi:MAG: hypothetical protein ACK5SX_00390 [Sandaracinobacter sp.]